MNIILVFEYTIRLYKETINRNQSDCISRDVIILQQLP